MRHFWMSLLLAGGWAAFLSCSDDGPSVLAGTDLDFVIQAPQAVESKANVDIVVTITRAERVEFPLRVVLEKANLGEDFFGQGALTLNEDQRVASFVAVPGRDPRFRVTVSESGELPTSVSKTIFVDVLDFP
ncbi:MAG TPA: hypothetical protein VJP59_06480 [Gemmatimonadota bacterium]|nr:hypothetical protein [Gemmatimonadota bacterium]